MIYTQDLADIICSEISSTSKSLRTICDQEGMPCVVTIMTWLRTNPEFLKQYTRAKEEQADLMVEDMLDISEHTDEDHTPFTGSNVVQRDRLRIETRKWIASKLKPKKYGEKVQTEISGSLNTGIDISKLSEETLKQLLDAQNTNG